MFRFIAWFLLIGIPSLGFAQIDVTPVTSVAGSSATVDVSIEPRLFKGTDRVFASPKAPQKLDSPGISFKFEDAPIQDVIQLVLRDIVKADYVIHPPLNGSVTLATRAEVSADQALFLLESALQANGIAMVRDSRGTFHLGRADAIKGIVATPRVASSGQLPPGSGAIIVPLQYIGASEMAAILRPLVPPESLLRVDPVRNLIILAGTRTQAEGWLELVSTFDVNLLQGMSVGVFPLKHASASEVEAALQLLASGGGRSGGTGGAAPSTNANTSSSATQNQGPTVTGGVDINTLLGAVRIMPITRINSILVVTSRSAYLEDARRWIEKLDRPGVASGELQLYVYPVQNGSAKHLANVLSSIFGQGAASGTQANSGVAPSLASTTAASSGVTGQGLNLGVTQGMNVANRSTGANSSPQGPGVTSVNVGVNLRVIADEINNAVLIYGSRSDYAKIESALRKLDVTPTQVLIEASIIEVTLSDDLQYGLQWVFNDSARTSGALTGNGVLSNVAGGNLGGATAGFSYSLSNPLGNIKAILNALATKSLVNVISSPSLMVLDNHTAAITVGNQQPIQSGQTITTGGVISSSIQYKDTGVSLTVTPSVNAGNLVTMQVNQSVTDVGQIDAATQQRAFLQRQFSSKVAVRSGESLVLGGLIRDNTTSGKNGVPLLQDLPILGHLFGTNSKNTARTELIVVITPRVVRSDQDVREVSSDLRERMKGLPSLEKVRGASTVTP